MSIGKDTQDIAINLGSGGHGSNVAGSIQISTNPPSDIGAGVTVYGFDNGRLSYMDILVEEVSLTQPDTSSIVRVRAHTDLSPLDHVCVTAILDQYDQNPPNEIFCKLKKLDHAGVRELSVVVPKQEESPIDVSSDIETDGGNPNA